MGLTYLEVEVGNPARPEVVQTIQFLADSGAVYSVVPEATLEELGIKPLTFQEFILADGTKISRKKGIALFKYQEKIGGADVIFGEGETRHSLGCFHLGSAWVGARSSQKGVEAVTDDARMPKVMIFSISKIYVLGPQFPSNKAVYFNLMYLFIS